MRVIIAGSRNITDYSLVERAIELSGFEITEVVSGCCKGIDILGERWAAEHNISVKRFPADWEQFGKAAGMIRNKQMAKYVGLTGGLIAIPSESSRRARGMIQIAKDIDIKCFVLEAK
jgi:hypothetical protein